MSAHTPGPWMSVKVDSLAGEQLAYPLHTIWSVDEGLLLARTCFAPASEANARLAAMAPELLTELKSLRALIHDLGVQDADDSWNEAVARADVVIAEAEGQS